MLCIVHSTPLHSSLSGSIRRSRRDVSADPLASRCRGKVFPLLSSRDPIMANPNPRMITGKSSDGEVNRPLTRDVGKLPLDSVDSHHEPGHFRVAIVEVLGLDGDQLLCSTIMEDVVCRPNDVPAWREDVVAVPVGGPLSSRIHRRVRRVLRLAVLAVLRGRRHGRRRERLQRAEGCDRTQSVDRCRA